MVGGHLLLVARPDLQGRGGDIELCAGHGRHGDLSGASVSGGPEGVVEMES